MSSRAPVVWYLGMGALVVIPAVIAIVLVWVASGQQIQVDQFYTSQGNTVVTDEEYRYWDSISRNAYQLVQVIAPTLFTGAVAAIFGILAVLAFRRERRRHGLAAQADVETAVS